LHGRHLPALGPRFWTALCLASIFGANMGDFFARDVGLGHIKGVPFLAVAFALVLIAERFDRAAHEAWYWIAIVIVRTAATNLADFMCGDMKLSRPLVMAGLAVLLAIVVTVAWLTWRSHKQTANDRPLVLRADTAYWVSMLVAGTLGTVMGDYFSHNLRLGDGVGGYRQILLPLPGKPSSLHIASTLSITAWSMRISRPHSRSVSPGHLLVASRPILEPRPLTGLAKSR
jgi:uncharacterized membrane-anchored protein